MQHEKIINSIKKIVKKERGISFAYIFGSVARGAAGPLSDIDIAVFLSKEGKRNKHEIAGKISGFIGPEHIDTVILNDAPLLMQFNVVKENIVIKDSNERQKFEYIVMNNYLDNEYHESLQTRIGLSRIAEKGLA